MGAPRENLINDLIMVHKTAKSIQDYEDAVYSLLFPKHLEFPQLYECPNCGRLAVFKHASDSSPVIWFKQEQTDIGRGTARIRFLVQEEI